MAKVLIPKEYAGFPDVLALPGSGLASVITTLNRHICAESSLSGLRPQCRID